MSPGMLRVAIGVVPPRAYSITLPEEVKKTLPRVSAQTAYSPSLRAPTTFLVANDRTQVPPHPPTAYNKSPLLVPGFIHDLPRPACVASAEACGIAPGTPIGGCEPPQPASIAAATQQISAQRIKSKGFTYLARQSRERLGVGTVRYGDARSHPRPSTATRSSSAGKAARPGCGNFSRARMCEAAASDGPAALPICIERKGVEPLTRSRV